ncbi:hypothetical protein ACWD6P_34295 [Streptomyces sp. NPDC002446]
MSAAAVRLGRAVTVAGPAGLLTLTAGWLLLDAGPSRTAVVWTGLAALAGCVLALAGHVLAAGRLTPRRGYELALAAECAPAPAASGAVPAVLHASRWPWARIGAVFLAVPTALVLFGCLGAGDPDRDATAARMAGAGPVIEELPVVAVGDVERAGPSRRASSVADYTVRLPAPDGGRGVPATFRTEVHHGVREPGDTLLVAHVPERPELGAVGATSRPAVEAELAGRTLSYGGAVLVAVVWVLVAGVAVVAGTSVTGPPRRSRRPGKGWVALRATVTGAAEHLERPDGGSGSGDDRKNAARYACLTLRTEDGPVPLRLAAVHRRAAEVLTGTDGWLLWNPADTGGKVPADFVTDDGRQLPGRIPAAEAARIAAARPRGPVRVDPGRRTRLLEPGGHWPRTVPAGVLPGMAVSVAAAGALLLPADGGWRAWAAVAGALAPVLGWMAAGLFTAPAAGGPAERPEAEPAA